MIDTIYLDLDGVVANFEKRYKELFGMKPSEVSKKEKYRELYFWTHWDDFVNGKNFETLELLPDANELIEYLRNLNREGINVEILSSSGGEKHHEVVVPQKKAWLQAVGIEFKPNIVCGGKAKAAFAQPSSILIDDTERLITEFNAAGGIGILHTSAYDTIKRIEQIVKDGYE